MDEAAIEVTSKPEEMAKLTREEQAQVILARLMEGGQEDVETCKALDDLTKLLSEDSTSPTAVTSVIDDVCVDTICGYLDMRQPDAVRGNAILTVSALLKALGDETSRVMTKFFFDRVTRGTYDDFIVAFCVAAAIFPIAPPMTTEIFLTEGFLPSLGPLMKRKWKSRKVETACLEMLNAASMHTACRNAIDEICTPWLEEIVLQDPNDVAKAIHSADAELPEIEGSISMRRHCQAVKTLASVILAKTRAVPSANKQQNAGKSRVTLAETSIEDLSKSFTSLLLTDPEFSTQHAVEGLAYSSIQPVIKEDIAQNTDLLKTLVNTLAKAPPKSPLTYGVLSIFQNLTRYQPTQSEEEKKMNQLKAYANAAGKMAAPNPLNDDDHVSKRCLRVFEAGITPVLVTHSRNGSTASFSIIISIILSLSATKSLRGQLAQQGSINLLIAAFLALPESEDQTKRAAAHALAKILISTDPALAFGGTRARPQSTAIRPLVFILQPDPAADTRDLLPTFESLMALTNLASTDDDTRGAIVRTAWDAIEEQLLSSNSMVSKAAVELICNLVQSVDGVAQYAADTPQAFNRLHIMLALADAEDEATRSAAGGALASLTAYEEVAKGVVKRERGIEVVLGMCSGEESEDLRHRGVFVVYNLISMEGDVGRVAREKVKACDGVEVLKGCVKASRRSEVVEVAVEVLKVLLEG